MKGLAFDVYGTLIDPAKIADALSDVTSEPAELAATWRAKQIEYTFPCRSWTGSSPSRT